jgi:formylglycine-generating enzyme required for sulfatase activity
MNSKIKISLLILISFVNRVYSNNISVSNVTITGQNFSAGTNNSANFSNIKFDVAWENSWRSASLNWDAAWLFAKYRVNGGEWKHCNLNNTGHTTPSGSMLEVGLVAPATAFNSTTNPGVGAFIYRSADGNGNVNYQNVQLRWNYGSQGVLDADILDIQVFAIEMVYVPTGAFAAGDGFSPNSFTITTINTGVANTAPSGIGSLGGQAGGYPTGIGAPNTLFPNGYNAFYCMKYEVSQGMYRDFLNTLNFNQQAGNYELSPPNSPIGSYITYAPNKIRIKASGISPNLPAVVGCDFNENNIYDENGDGQWQAFTRLDFNKSFSFLDWAGLRPMTELEFEKSCRGPNAPVEGEFAWGTPFYKEHTFSGGVQNTGFSNENLGPTEYKYGSDTGNTCTVLAYYNGSTPQLSYGIVYRCGIFAGNALNTGRVSSGGTFYGIMDMTGNCTEPVIQINSSFLGTHGDGSLDSAGRRTNADWTNSGARGIAEAFNVYPVSLRSGQNYSFSFNVSLGCRGARTVQ